VYSIDRNGTVLYCITFSCCVNGGYRAASSCSPPPTMPECKLGRTVALLPVALLIIEPALMLAQTGVLTGDSLEECSVSVSPVVP
jgi:hypothetical protein